MQRKKKGGNEYEMSVLWSSGYAGDRFQTGGRQQRHPKKKIRDECGKRFTTYEKVETIP